MARAGVLIVGSLYWDKAEHRVAWRDGCFTEAPGIPVKVPLRYGRRSMGRAKTYTMVFAPGCPDGQGKIFACRRDINELDVLINEAKSLWTAERTVNSDPVAHQQHSASWGCVVVLPRPNAKGIQQLLNDWEKHVASETYRGGRTYDSGRFTVNGRAAVTDSGLLDIDWPVRVDTGEPLDSFDLLLATATMPTPVNGDYPDAKTVADAWNGAGSAEYFHMNRKHRFWTFQDAEIERHLRV